MARGLVGWGLRSGLRLTCPALLIPNAPLLLPRALPPHPLGRFQELERTQAASDEQLAQLAASGEQMAEFRSNLDLASKQMAMVLEMLQTDMAALKWVPRGPHAGLDGGCCWPPLARLPCCADAPSCTFAE
jgi:hypothetical protein